MSRLEGRPVVRSPKQLRLHRALEERTGVIVEFDEATRSRDQSVPKPILITTNGTILAGFGRWRSALFDDRYQINCIEYPLSEDAALEFIISYHQPQRGRNDFVRICLALTLEPYFQQKAFDNMRAGGKHKGSTNLSEADCMDVRQEIAKVAGTGTGKVSKVKAIMQSSHPNIIVALQNGLLRIHRAWQWCKLSKLQQKEEFASGSASSGGSCMCKSSRGKSASCVMPGAMSGVRPLRSGVFLPSKTDLCGFGGRTGACIGGSRCSARSRSSSTAGRNTSPNAIDTRYDISDCLLHAVGPR